MVEDSIVYVNGVLAPGERATVSALDRGLLFGDGVFETMRVYDGVTHMLSRHLDRLVAGGAELRLRMPLRGDLEWAVRETIRQNRMADGIVKVIVTRGVGGTVHDVSPCEAPTVIVHVRPLLQNRYETTGDPTIIVKGVRVCADGWLPLKSLNYLRAIRAGFEIVAAGVREGILLADDGSVAEGSVSNIFCCAGGALWTPPLELGILPGITRDRIIELARREGIRVREERFPCSFLTAADEVFYTNAGREVVSVTTIDGAPIGDGRSGPLTEQLGEAYRAEIPNESL